MSEENKRKSKTPSSTSSGSALNVEERGRSYRKGLKYGRGRLQSRGKSKPPGACWTCGKKGHFRRDCASSSSKKNDEVKDTMNLSEEFSSDEALLLSCDDVSESWIIDSGASFHATANLGFLLNVVKGDYDASGTSILARGSEVRWGEFTLGWIGFTSIFIQSTLLTAVDALTSLKINHFANMYPRVRMKRSSMSAPIKTKQIWTTCLHNNKVWNPVYAPLSFESTWKCSHDRLLNSQAHIRVLLYYAFLSVFTLLIAKLCFQLNHNKKNLPPTPLALPIVGHLHLVKKNPLYKSLQTLADKYGSIIFLKLGSRPVLVISSTSAVEECFTKNDIIFANRVRSVSGDHLSKNYSALSWVPYGHQWRNLRRIIAIEVFSTNSPQRSACIRNEEVQFLIRGLFEATNGGSQNVDLRITLTELSFNVIMRAIEAFSTNSLQRSACIRNEEVQFLIRGLFEASNGGSQKVDLKINLSGLTFNVIMRGVAGKRCFESGMDKKEKKHVLKYLKELGDFFPALRRVCFRSVDNRMEKLQKERNIQSRFDRRASKKDRFFSYKYDEQKAMLTAGTDTTALMMEWAMALLVNHPEVLHKAHSEIKRNIQQGRLLDESDLPKLLYLNCIINETLRLYPVAPLLIPHFSSEDCTVGGYNVPRGTMLIGNAWAIHRDPKVWVEPSRFMPERFEGGETEKVDGYKFIPFGVGRRSCPGSGLAMRVVGLALGTLIQCFEWKRIGEEQVDMSAEFGITLPKIKPLVVMCKPRPNMIDILSQL
ncbi:hypothetical protein GIB67_023512 [Kingdonia uniflora]|uniref:CCHC-type domain-containing protein n=1 Tax=Kingdonia uniflora TaxID=39325 RepID=A0A7J7P9W1_9MAGN|nr:hypothetical protein GIB67_023512 [Kingdonia uniflora]